MHATVGDRLHVHSRIVDKPDRSGEVVEVRGADGGPPYLVRFDDGNERLMYPGSDCTVDKPTG